MKSRAGPVLVAGFGLLALAWYLGPNRLAALLSVGAGLGFVLHRTSFGFASAYRSFLTERRGSGVRAQILLLTLSCLMFYPALGHGAVFGQSVDGFVVGVSLSLAAGSFLFGIGMQLAGGCGSGTLFTLGGGSTRMPVTLCGFIAGSLVGVAHLPRWLAWPSFPPVSVIARWGWPLALMANLACLGLLWVLAGVVERQRYGSRQARFDNGQARGAAAIAILGFLTLILAGRPWGITQAFALWGGKILAVAGADPAGWQGWEIAGLSGALTAPVLSDVTSVMNFGIILGALLSAGLSGRFHSAQHVSMGQWLAAVLGGLAMGYGARLAAGCNIGAFLGGVVSGSPHGWVWILFALGGSAVGIRLRPRFGLAG